MSFAFDVKNELAMSENITCCAHAEAYGLLLFGRSFSSISMGLLTENEIVALRYAQGISSLIGVMPEIFKSAASKYKVFVKNQSDRQKILTSFGYIGNEVSIRLNRANLYNECCYKAFLRGAFLSSGTITDPEKEYHLEFSVAYKNLCADLIKLFDEFSLNPKKTVRNNSYVVYFKDSESIEDVLTYMGAVNNALELMGVKLYKNIINNTNRRVNFDNANINRSIQAAVIQIKAIKKIQKRKGLDSLPDKLKEIALLRLENPEMSQKDLLMALKEPSSLSAVNRRLRQITDIAKELD